MPTITEKTAQYLKESYFEMKNVTWPTKDEIKQHTVLVIAISLAVAAFLGLVDYLLTAGLTQLIGLLK
jgi:preprotein translocase subunit SecE